MHERRVANEDHTSRLHTEEERKGIEEVTRREPLPIVLEMALHAHLVRQQS
jgi:hypothetical protein